MENNIKIYPTLLQKEHILKAFDCHEAEIETLKHLGAFSISPKNVVDILKKGVRLVSITLI